MGGFAFEIVNLQFAVLGVVKLRSSVDEWHAIAQHAIDQSSQLSRHSLNGNGSPELSFSVGGTVLRDRDCLDVGC
jgi:hypothetical protein